MKPLYQKPVIALTGILIITLFTGIAAFNQSPGTFSYQAALRDASGNLIANTSASIQLILLQGSVEGSEVYNETHSVTTNALGLVTLAVGSKDPEEFAGIDWTTGPYFLKVSVNGTVMGTSQLLSVPYAILAKTVESLTLPYADSTALAEDVLFKMKNKGSGKTVGLWGEATSVTGVGVKGQGSVYGVWGESTGAKGRAVLGKALDERSIGVYGIALGENSSGVFGEGMIYDFYANGPGVDYGTGSSIRWKKNVACIASPLEKIKAIRGVTFDWDAEHGGRHDVGMIAEEVGKVIPEIVVYEENGVDAIGMDYSKMTPLLLEALKAQQAEIEALKAELAGLREKLNK